MSSCRLCQQTTMESAENITVQTGTKTKHLSGTQCTLIGSVYPFLQIFHHSLSVSVCASVPRYLSPVWFIQLCLDESIAWARVELSARVWSGIAHVLVVNQRLSPSPLAIATLVTHVGYISATPPLPSSRCPWLLHSDLWPRLNGEPVLYVRTLRVMDSQRARHRLSPKTKMDLWECLNWWEPWDWYNTWHFISD